MEDRADSVPYPGEEELRARTKRRALIGLILLVSPVFLLLALITTKAQEVEKGMELRAKGKEHRA